MKKYCLTHNAKENIKGTLTAIVFLIGFFLVTYGVAAFILYLGGESNSMLDLILGIASWTLMLSYFAILFKRWLQDNIVEC